MDIRVDGLVLLSTVNNKYSTSAADAMGCAFSPNFFFDDNILLGYFFFSFLSQVNFIFLFSTIIITDIRVIEND